MADEENKNTEPVAKKKATASKKKAVSKKKVGVRKTARKIVATPPSSVANASVSADAAGKQEEAPGGSKNVSASSGVDTSSSVVAKPAKVTGRSSNISFEFTLIAMIIIFMVVFLAVFDDENIGFNEEFVQPQAVTWEMNPERNTVIESSDMPVEEGDDVTADEMAATGETAMAEMMDKTATDEVEVVTSGEIATPAIVWPPAYDTDVPRGGIYPPPAFEGSHMARGDSNTYMGGSSNMQDRGYGANHNASRYHNPPHYYYPPSVSPPVPLPPQGGMRRMPANLPQDYVSPYQDSEPGRWYWGTTRNNGRNNGVSWGWRTD